MSKAELIRQTHHKIAHADAEWSYRFNLDGKTYKGKTDTTNKRDAERFAEQVYQAEKLRAKKESDIGRGPMTFGRACDVWVAEKFPKLAGTGVLAQIRDFSSNTSIRKLLLHKVPASAITRMALARAETLRPGRGGVMQRVTSTTVNQSVDLLRRIFNYAAKAHEGIDPAL